MSNHLRPSVLIGLLIVVVSITVALPAAAACGPVTPYSVSGSAPATANWTDPTLWSAVSYPGSGTCDGAQNLNVATTIVVNTVIPNALGNIDFHCSGCVIDIQTGGQLTIAGPGAIEGAIVQINGGELVINTSIADGGVVFQSASQLELTSGVLSGSGLLQTDPGSLINWTSSDQVFFNGLLIKQNGTMMLSPSSPSTLSLLNGALIDNWGTIDIMSALQIGNVGLNSIKNGGIVTIGTGINVEVFSKFEQYGSTITVPGGSMLSLGGGGEANAPFFLEQDGVLNIPSGSYTLDPGGSVAGAGKLAVTGGTLSIGGVTEPDVFHISAGTLTGDGFLSIGKFFDWTGGTITGNGGSELEGGGSGSINGADGPMFLDGRTFNNYGNLSFSSPTNPLQLSNGAVLATYNNFDIQDDGSITCDCTVPSLVKIAPNGILMKGGGSGTFLIVPPTENSATVWSFSGTLQFSGGGTHTGSFNAFNGAKILFSNEPSTFQLNSSINGDGTIEFLDANATVQGFFDVAGETTINNSIVSVEASAKTHDFAFDEGTLQLFDTFTITGTGDWHEGTIEGNGGTFNVDSGATLRIDGSAILNLVELVNDGTIEYSSVDGSDEYFTLQNAIVTNNGVFDIQTDAPIIEDDNVVVGSITVDGGVGSDSVIVNFGTLKKSGGSGTTDVEPDLDNAGDVLALSGTLNVDGSYTQSAGSTVLGPGSISTSLLEIDGGTVTGEGTITGNVDNGGTVAPGNAGAGILDISGDYLQLNTGAIEIEIGGDSSGQFDQLNVSGDATLDGTFTATLINSYAPADSTTFTVLTYGTHSGSFAVENLPTYAPGGSFTSSYNPTDFELTAHIAPTSADVRLQMSGPATVDAGTALSYTITVDNLGPDATSGTITVTNTLPAGVTGASGSGSGWSCGAPVGGVITCTNTTSIAMSQALPTLTIAMTAPVGAGLITNAATVTALTPDSDNGNDAASVNTTVVAQADLAITKSGPNGVTSGQNIVYTITVTNNGPSTANGVTVSDPTPANLTFVSNSGACTTAFPCNLGTLTAGQSAVITSTYSTSPSFDGNVTNTAAVSSSTADFDNSNDTASKITNVGAQADLSVTKSGPALTSPGQDVVYTITITNNGSSPATNAIVDDPTPVGIAFLSNSGACTTPYPCNVGTLNNGQSVVITSTYTVPGNYSGATITNTATASSDVNDPDSTNDSGSATTNVLQQTDLSIVKSGPATVALGQTLTYTIVVTNDGPATAAGVMVNDPTPAGITFSSNSGACTTAFPCHLGTLTVGQTATITSTYNVPPGYADPSITNIATVSSSGTDLDASDNTSTAVTAISASSSADLSIIKNGPGEATAGGTVDFIITVFNSGPSSASTIVVSDPTPDGLTFTGNSGACGTAFPCSIAPLGPGQSATIIASYDVDENAEGTIANTATVTSATSDPESSNNSDSAFVALSCVLDPPHILTPAANATVNSPVTLSWSASSSAIDYTVTITGGIAPVVITTANTSTTATLPSGTYTWTVRANTNDECDSTSSASTFLVCGSPVAPAASVIGMVATGQTYTVQWTPVDGASSYELEESRADAFLAPVIIPVNGTSHTFTKNVQSPTPFYYRVRALFTLCGSTTGPHSQVARVAVVPLPATTEPNPHVSVQVGSTQAVTFQAFIPGLPEGTTTFVATTDKPWLSVTPTSGIITPDGLNVTVAADPSTLTNGTWTGTIVIAYGPIAVSHPVVSEAGVAKIGSIPISISLVTPVTPTLYAAPGPNAFVIPAVGHLSGAISNWFSDVRLANVSSLARKYQVTFNGAGMVRQTTIDVDAGVTTALDDLVRNWYGFGNLGDSASGMLIIQALDSAGRVIDDPAISKTTIVSSRTYNASATNAAAGTLGQFIPATLFGQFIGRNAFASMLSLQQIAESTAYRTNLGFAEAAGSPVQLLVSIFGTNGSRLLQVPMSLNAGEQRQLNSFIAQQGITLPDGRIAVEVIGGDGKVTAYASVVDALTTDPLVVSGAPLLAAGPSRFVVPGVADLDTGSANWRTDVRVFNSSTAPQNTTLTFFPSTGLSPTTKQLSIEPGEVKALDGIVRSLFDLQSVGGSLHVVSDDGAPLVVTARTYNQTENGTIGQFIPAVTEEETVGVADRALHVVQAEESARYRTNLGITEVTGNPVTVEISVSLPDSKVSPTVQVPLGANEFRQMAILSQLGLGATYNARVSVRVVEGEGRVTVYGSILDRVKEDPTFVPAR